MNKISAKENTIRASGLHIEVCCQMPTGEELHGIVGN